ncbi:MAG: hypothetical protein ACI4RD_00930 [Kiritimatiellia bacterium]
MSCKLAKEKMNALKVVSEAAIGAVLLSGCSTMTMEERRAEYAKEYAALAALPPAQRIVSPNRAVDDCARLSHDLFNTVQPLMKAYVSSVENSYEYAGFMNDVRYYVEEEKLSVQAACRKVVDAVVAADANRPADQKVWPKIQKGIVAANALEPKKMLVRIGVLIARNAEITRSVSRLPGAFKHEDMMAKVRRGVECSAISAQLARSLECLVYLSDTYTRVLELEAYAR